MNSKSNLKNQLHALVWKEGKIYVAKCAEVEVASQGSSKAEAVKNLEEALDLYFEGEKISTPEALMNLEVLKVSPRYV